MLMQGEDKALCVQIMNKVHRQNAFKGGGPRQVAEESKGCPALGRYRWRDCWTRSNILSVANKPGQLTGLGWWIVP